MNQNKALELTKDIATDIIGGILIAVGVYNFAAAAKFPMVGVNGIALIFYQLFGLPIGTVALILNIPIAICCFRLLGRRFFLNSVRTIIITSIIMDVIAPLFPVYQGDRLLSAICCGVLSGLGYAMIYMRDSSTGGSDFIMMSIKALNPHLSLGNIALISTCFFFTQLLIDLFCARFVDKIGYRVCIVTSEISSALGLVGLAFLPELLPDPFMGIIISVIVYAVGSGLIEVLCSPIMEACPFENKEATMSLLHSFYCWGSVGTIAVSTLFFAVFGMDSWKWLAVLWAIVPTINVYNFATCPIKHLVDEGKGMKIGELFRKPVFWIAVCLMVCSGASELSMSQWASAYAEAALGLSKTIGDLAGPCMFAITMGISRVIFGKYGDKMDLMKFMAGSGILCVFCYLLASLSSNPAAGLIDYYRGNKLVLINMAATVRDGIADLIIKRKIGEALSEAVE